MPDYYVKWAIDIFDAKNPREAAERALEIHRDPESIATVFVVETHESDEITLIDLSLDTEEKAMKPQTIPKMIEAGASTDEAQRAWLLFTMLRPGLRIKKENGRIETEGGDKTVLGLYRTIKHEIMKG